MTAALERLAALARDDATAAPLARLHLEALRASADPAWTQAAPSFADHRLADGFPLLHGHTLSVAPNGAETLLERLMGEVGRSDDEAFGGSRIDASSLLEACVCQDDERLGALASAAGADPELLAAVGQLLSLPLLRACGARARDVLDGAAWEAGYCPVCAAWPTLAERRGLERRRWLRCGRCGAGWSQLHPRCIFCGDADFRKQGYLAPEDDRESRRALTCDACRGYLKAVTTLSELGADEVSLRDLDTLELDAAALDRDYGRPAQPGFPLRVRVDPVRPAVGWPP